MKGYTLGIKQKFFIRAVLRSKLGDALRLSQRISAYKNIHSGVTVQLLDFLLRIRVRKRGLCKRGFCIKYIGFRKMKWLAGRVIYGFEVACVKILYSIVF